LELPPKAREVFILIYVCGMKGSAVAKEMNVGRSAVSMNKSFAVSRLHEALAV
jgi:DNA-directed RNA polymerase specialized sigma24 family protein